MIIFDVDRLKISRNYCVKSLNDYGNIIDCYTKNNRPIKWVLLAGLKFELRQLIEFGYQGMAALKGDFMWWVKSAAISILFFKKRK